MPDFVGGDPESNASECPAVFVDGDFLFRGKTVTDPALITLRAHRQGRDESDVWLPPHGPAHPEALDGYASRPWPAQLRELLASTTGQ